MAAAAGEHGAGQGARRAGLGTAHGNDDGATSSRGRDGAAARAALEPVYGRLTEGFDTADALRARDLIEAVNRVN